MLKEKLKKHQKRTKPLLHHHNKWLQSVQHKSKKKKATQKKISKQGRKEKEPTPVFEDTSFGFDHDGEEQGRIRKESEKQVEKPSQETEKVKTEETEKVNVSEDTVEVRDKSSEQKVGEVPTSAPAVTTAPPITILEVEEDIQDDDMVLVDALVRMKGTKFKGVSIKDVESAEVEKRKISSKLAAFAKDRSKS